MTAETETLKAIDKAFRTALLLTGSTDVAETAVLDGIATLECGSISGDSLLIETVKSAVHRSAGLPDQFDRARASLPLELRRLFLLAPNLRHCFVLRILLGMTPQVCSGILQVPVDEVEDTLRTSMQELPLVGGCGSTRRESSAPRQTETLDESTLWLRAAGFRAPSEVLYPSRSGVTHGC